MNGSVDQLMTQHLVFDQLLLIKMFSQVLHSASLIELFCVDELLSQRHDMVFRHGVLPTCNAVMAEAAKDLHW